MRLLLDFPTIANIARRKQFSMDRSMRMEFDRSQCLKNEI
jgi:hypothetical protein